MKILFLQVKTRQAARKAAPWAGVIIKVEGGYMCFESQEDMRIWSMQS